MATRKYEVKLSEKLAQHFGNSKEEIEDRLFEDTILTLLFHSKIVVLEAAKLLNCDPDDLLTPEEETSLAESVAQSKRGKVVSWGDLKKEAGLV